MEQGPIEQRWEQPGAKPRLADVVDYRPSAHDATDGVTLRGVAKVRRGRSWGRLGTAIFGVVCCSLFAWAGVYDILWFLGGLVILLTCVASIVVQKPSRRESWSRPVVTVNREGITVSDVNSLTYSGTWAELNKLRARSYDGAREVHLSWVTPSGHYVTANLGDTIDLMELRRAILTQAPPDMTFRLGARGAYGDD